MQSPTSAVDHTAVKGLPPDLCRIILFVDCDAFYASCEVAHNPELRDLPVGVLQNGRLITTCNHVARALGVSKTSYATEGLRICPSMILVEGDMERYRAYSRRLIALLKEYGDVVEKMSIDEAAVDVTEMVARHMLGEPWPWETRDSSLATPSPPSSSSSPLHSSQHRRPSQQHLQQCTPNDSRQTTITPMGHVIGQLNASSEVHQRLVMASHIAHNIRDAVYRRIGITVSIGISTNKLLSKLASDAQKKSKGANQQTLLVPEEGPAWVGAMRLRRIPGIGRARARMLHTLVCDQWNVGHHKQTFEEAGLPALEDLTAAEVRETLSLEDIQRVLPHADVVWGALWGRSLSPVHDKGPPKSMSVEGFDQIRARTYAHVDTILLEKARDLASRIRADHAMYERMPQTLGLKWYASGASQRNVSRAHPMPYLLGGRPMHEVIAESAGALMRRVLRESELHACRRWGLVASRFTAVSESCDSSKDIQTYFGAPSDVGGGGGGGGGGGVVPQPKHPREPVPCPTPSLAPHDCTTTATTTTVAASEMVTTASIQSPTTTDVTTMDCGSHGAAESDSAASDLVARLRQRAAWDQRHGKRLRDLATMVEQRWILGVKKQRSEVPTHHDDDVNDNDDDGCDDGDDDNISSTTTKPMDATVIELNSQHPQDDSLASGGVEASPLAILWRTQQAKAHHVSKTGDFSAKMTQLQSWAHDAGLVWDPSLLHRALASNGGSVEAAVHWLCCHHHQEANHTETTSTGEPYVV